MAITRYLGALVSMLVLLWGGIDVFREQMIRREFEQIRVGEPWRALAWAPNLERTSDIESSETVRELRWTCLLTGHTYSVFVERDTQVVARVSRGIPFSRVRPYVLAFRVALVTAFAALFLLGRDLLRGKRSKRKNV